MDSLKPCPRHGTAPVYDHTKCDGVRFSCNACDEDTFDDFEDAAAAWNTRSEGLPPPGGGGNEGNQGDSLSQSQPLEGRGDPCPALSADAVRPGMVERVAKAICDEEWNGTQPWGRKPESFHERYRAAARAAIEAMREPTDEMTLAAEALDKFYPFSSERSEVAEDEAKWRAMIDVALSPEGPHP